MALGVAGNFGLSGVRTLSGTPFTINPYNIKSDYGVALVPGDAVQLSADGAQTGQYIARHNGTGPVLGIFVGVTNFTPVNTSAVSMVSQCWIPNMAVTDSLTVCEVIDNKDLVFNMVVTAAGGTATATLAATDIGLNADIQVALASNTAFAISGMSLNHDAMDTTLARPLKIIGLANVAGNSFGLAYNEAACIFNNHYYKGGTGTLGI